MRRCNRKLLTLILTAALLVLSLRASPALAQEETPTSTPTPTPTTSAVTTVKIVSPTPNQVLAGLVTIQGTATGPAFRFYEIEIAPDPSPSDYDWPNIQPAVTQQVRNGALGQWDTTSVPDGRYIIRLSLTRESDEGELETVDDEVRVEVINSTATPVPQRLTATPTATPGTPTPGPSPTPLIQQPPTRTPRPTFTPGGPTNTPAAPPLSADDSPLQPERLQNAARNGMIATLALFMILGVYSIARAARRGTLDEDWRAFKRDVINPLIDGLRGR